MVTCGSCAVMTVVDANDTFRPLAGFFCASSGRNGAVVDQPTAAILLVWRRWG